MFHIIITNDTGLAIPLAGLTESIEPQRESVYTMLSVHPDSSVFAIVDFDTMEVFEVYSVSGQKISE